MCTIYFLSTLLNEIGTGSTGAASVPGTISTPASTVSTQRASTTGGSMRLLVHATGWILPLITGTALF
ncbi:unnamed protein product [Fasciola hepatica]|uniref:Uncharacterized protein n=1 Tax=Fasciola hepatica TaxID=6192 RepID=A0ABC9HH57_FASHE|nr:unnamed protein product [Fasciola hepatica]CAK6928110.1 unnamed protein product [Fasciola hepatica]CAK6928111.1 unnamed protein product [Fasciola hepatica]CAK6928112.1 unnamed protein product [Fasciola hepatica]CAK6928113.1 unnamed protein product [Fasciola hepatica]